MLSDIERGESQGHESNTMAQTNNNNNSSSSSNNNNSYAISTSNGAASHDTSNSHQKDDKDIRAKEFELSNLSTSDSSPSIALSNLPNSTAQIQIKGMISRGPGQLKKNYTIDDLPEEIVVMIVKHLSAKELLIFCQANKYFNKICLSDDLWRVLYFRDWVKFDKSDFGLSNTNNSLRIAFGGDNSGDNSSETSLFSSLLRRPSNLDAMISPRQHYQRKLALIGEDKYGKDQARKKREKTLQLYKKQRQFIPILEFFGWRLPLIAGGVLPSISFFFLLNNLEYLQEVNNMNNNSTSNGTVSQLMYYSLLYDFNDTFHNYTDFNITNNSTGDNTTYTPTSTPTIFSIPTLSPTISNGNHTHNITVSFIPWYSVFAPVDVWFFILLLSLIVGTFVSKLDNANSVFYGLDESLISILSLTREFWNEVDRASYPYAIPLLSWTHFTLLTTTVALVSVKLELQSIYPNLTWTVVYAPLLTGILLMAFPEYVFGNRRLRHLEPEWLFEWTLELVIAIGLLLITLYADGYLKTTLAIALIPFWILWAAVVVVGILVVFLDPMEDGNGPVEIFIRVAFVLLLLCFPSGLIAIASGVKYPEALYGQMIIFVGIGACMLYAGLFVESQFTLIDPVDHEEDPFDIQTEENPGGGGNSNGVSGAADPRTTREIDANRLIHAAPSFFFTRENDIENAVNKLSEHASKTCETENTYFSAESGAADTLANALAETNGLQFNHDFTANRKWKRRILVQRTRDISEATIPANSAESDNNSEHSPQISAKLDPFPTHSFDESLPNDFNDDPTASVKDDSNEKIPASSATLTPEELYMLPPPPSHPPPGLADDDHFYNNNHNPSKGAHHQIPVNIDDDVNDVHMLLDMPPPPSPPPPFTDQEAKDFINQQIQQHKQGQQQQQEEEEKVDETHLNETADHQEDYKSA